MVEANYERARDLAILFPKFRTQKDGSLFVLGGVDALLGLQPQFHELYRMRRDPQNGRT